MNKDEFELQEELLRQNNNDMKAVYALALKKTAEYFSRDEEEREEYREFKVWLKLRNICARNIADELLLQNGYREAYTEKRQAGTGEQIEIKGGYRYLEKEVNAC